MRHAAAPILSDSPTYAPNAPFWSDGSTKARFLALPNGQNITVGADGDWDFPNGSVLVKNFALGTRLVETRLFMRHPDGIWAGYTGPGTKTLLPHEASVKMDVRMVPKMEPDAVVASIRKHLDDHGFSDIEMNVLNKYHWSKVSINEPVVKAMLKSYDQMGKRVRVEPINPGSAPYWIFERVLGIPYVTGGLGHGARQHSSNEYCTVQGVLDFEKSMVLFLDNYAKTAKRKKV